MSILLYGRILKLFDGNENIFMQTKRFLNSNPVRIQWIRWFNEVWIGYLKKYQNLIFQDFIVFFILQSMWWALSLSHSIESKTALENKPTIRVQILMIAKLITNQTWISKEFRTRQYYITLYLSCCKDNFIPNCAIKSKFLWFNFNFHM